MVLPVEVLVRLGGYGDLQQVLAGTSRRRLRTALDRGEVVRVGRGRYALPTTVSALRAASRLAGTASHTSAAALHGWELATQPEVPWVIVPRNRNVATGRRRGVELRWRDLRPDEIHGRVTAPTRTVVDCARDLPFTDALTVADSALRHGTVDQDRLLDVAATVGSHGRRQALRVAGAASPLAANPFESVLRAIALDVPGLDLQPQVVVEEDGFRCRPDLVDRRRRLVVEADSFAWHGGREALTRDCVRYNALVVRGWTVLRFAWEHVMLHRSYVRACLESAAGRPDRRAVQAQTPQLIA